MRNLIVSIMLIGSTATDDKKTVFKIERNGSFYALPPHALDNITKEPKPISNETLPLLNSTLQTGPIDTANNDTSLFASAATCPFPQYSTTYDSLSCLACPSSAHARGLAMPWAPMSLRINGNFGGRKCVYMRMAGNQPAYSCGGDYYIWWWVHSWHGIGGYGEGPIGGNTYTSIGASPGGYWENGQPNPVNALLLISSEIEWCSLPPATQYRSLTMAWAPMSLRINGNFGGRKCVYMRMAGNQPAYSCGGDYYIWWWVHSWHGIGGYGEGPIGGNTYTSIGASPGGYWENGQPNPVNALLAISTEIRWFADCPPGSFSASAGATACTLCSPGTQNNAAGASTCTSCSVGTYSISLGTIACTLCSAGTYLTTQGTSAASCIPCGAGSYSSALGHTAPCTLCGAGSYSTAAGLVDMMEATGITYSFSSAHSSICQSPALDSESGWCSAGYTSDWTQIDMGQTRDVRGFVTQGRASHPQWVTGYMITFSNDNRTWSGFNNNIYIGNSDMSTRRVNFVNLGNGYSSIFARYIRLNLSSTTSFSGFYSLRWNVLVAPTISSSLIAQIKYSPCQPCAAGTYSISTGTSSPCTACPQAKYSTAEGATTPCLSCQLQCPLPGQYSTCGNDTTGGCSVCANPITPLYFALGTYGCPTAQAQPGYFRNATNPRAPMWITTPPAIYGSWCTFRSVINNQPYYFCSKDKIHLWWQNTQWVGSPDFSLVGTNTFAVSGPTVDGSAYTNGEYQPITALISTEVLDAGVNWVSLCSKGAYSASEGSVSCTPAPVGQYVPNSGATTSLQCASGTFSSTTGASACTVCSTACGIGKEVQGACTSTTDTPCVPCAPVANCIFQGIGCGNSTNPNCVCAPGFEMVAGKCQQCKQGYFKATNSSLPCTQWTSPTCAANHFRSNGTRFSDTVCLPCPDPPGNAAIKGVECEWGCKAGYNNTAVK